MGRYIRRGRRAASVSDTRDHLLYDIASRPSRTSGRGSRRRGRDGRAHRSRAVRISRSDVVAFYAAVADASDLPIALFNYPSLTGIDFTASFVEELAEIDSVRYIKESTGDSKRVTALYRALGDRIQVICGAPTAALESLALGCTAWITGILNVVPGPGKTLMEAVHEHLELARGIYFDQILPVVDAMETTSNPTGVIKAGLRARGVRVGVPRAPGQDLRDDEETALRRTLERILGAS